MNREAQLYSMIDKLGQSHVLSYLQKLPIPRKARMLEQLLSLDFSVFDYQPVNRERGELSPPIALELSNIEDRGERVTAIGEHALHECKVGAVMLAGGQGSRLGFNHPKGMFNIGVDKPLFIFECQIKNLIKVCEKVQCWVPLFIMTSEDNHDETVEFFEKHGYFGYDSYFVWFFKQAQLPVLTLDNKLIITTDDRVLTAPNGNGGWYSSLATSGLLPIIKQFGIEWLNVFAVDNVLQKIADPLFLGAAIEMNWKSAAKVVRKVSPDERVGTFCNENVRGELRPTIIEYYEMDDDTRYSKNANGEYQFKFGVTLNYVFRVDELNSTLGRELPLHRAQKSMSYKTADGSLCESQVFKFETLALDLIEMQGECLPVEIVREEEFAPVKNKEGKDSVETARALLRLNGIEL